MAFGFGKGWTPQRIIASLIMFLITPLLYIGTFNSFFAAGIAYTVENWLLVFLAGILVFFLFIVLLLVIFLFATVISPLVLVGATVSLFLIPVLFIFSFNLLLAAAVPITIQSYLLVGVTIVGIWILSAFVSRVR